MYKLKNGQVVTLSIFSLIFAFAFKSVYWGVRFGLVMGAVGIIWNSHVALTEVYQQIKNAYLSLKSWFYDEHVDGKSFLKSLNTKPDSLKNFRLHHKSIFKLPLSRRAILSVINENEDMTKPCEGSMKTIVETI